MTTGHGQADEGVGDLGAERDDDRAGDDRQAHEAIGPGVIAVGDQGGAVQAAAGAQADERGGLVAEEADGAGDAERQQVVDVLGIDEPVERPGRPRRRR